VTLIAFLRRELAPAPGRFRAAARILVGCLAALLCSLVIGGSIAPHGHWVIITVYHVAIAREVLDQVARLRDVIERGPAEAVIHTG
jgi:uncharacterized membrane protein YccC